MKRIKRNHTLAPTTAEMIDRLAEGLNISKGEVIDRALLYLAKAAEEKIIHEQRRTDVLKQHREWVEKVKADHEAIKARKPSLIARLFGKGGAA